MKNLKELTGIHAENILTIAAATHIKGGENEFEKRRERPGGGINTNRPAANLASKP
jgi:hypothetical protein